MAPVWIDQERFASALNVLDEAARDLRSRNPFRRHRARALLVEAERELRRFELAVRMATSTDAQTAVESPEATGRAINLAELRLRYGRDA